MKCGVVTVYSSENCGSFLQAFALMQTLKKNGAEAVFICHNFSDHAGSPRSKFKKKVKFALKGNFAGLKCLKDQKTTFRRAIAEHLPVVKNADGLDCCVLGSDVIWDVSTSFFRNHTDFFGGTRFEDVKIIPYAPSVGSARAEDIEKCGGFFRDALCRMSAVSVRDEISKKLLQPYCDKEIQIVCDPTYLLDRADYDVIAKPTDLKDFLFIYYYGKMPADYRQAIQTFAKQKGLKTVTFGSSNPWCDVTLAYDPLLFLSIYDKADYIITNTFHGTVFATIYEKRFAVIKNDKPKVLDVLNLCEMSDKMTRTAEDISMILESRFCYEATRGNILREREKSLQYLKSAIEG